jgi:hypothetical protein
VEQQIQIGTRAIERHTVMARLNVRYTLFSPTHHYLHILLAFSTILHAKFVFEAPAGGTRECLR